MRVHLSGVKKSSNKSATWGRIALVTQMSQWKRKSQRVSRRNKAQMLQLCVHRVHWNYATPLGEKRRKKHNVPCESLSLFVSECLSPPSPPLDVFVYRAIASILIVRVTKIFTAAAPSTHAFMSWRWAQLTQENVVTVEAVTTTRQLAVNNFASNSRLNLVE